MHFPFEISIDKETRKGFPLDKEYFEQLTSEKLITVYDKGVPKRIWKKMRARNEALDLEVYATAAYYTLQADENTIMTWLDSIKNFSKQSNSTNDDDEPIIEKSNIWKDNWVNKWKY